MEVLQNLLFSKSVSISISKFMVEDDSIASKDIVMFCFGFCSGDVLDMVYSLSLSILKKIKISIQFINWL